MKVTLNKYKSPQQHAELYIIPENEENSLGYGLKFDLIEDFSGGNEIIFPSPLTREEAEKAKSFPEITEGKLIENGQYDSYEAIINVSVLKYTKNILVLKITVKPDDCDFYPWACIIKITPTSFSTKTEFID